MPETTAVATTDQEAGTPAGRTLAEANWQRYQYCCYRGHVSYIYTAARCEAFYLGSSGGICARGDGQWHSEDVQKLQETGKRPAYEFNGIMWAVNTAVGYQIHNRMDISYVPRGGMADTATAAIRSKVAMQILDANKYHWLETQVFSDGMIEQRGFFDIRMDFNENVYGDVSIGVLDPRDVAIDPDSKSYDPKDWFDVTVTRWYTLDQIEERWGTEARNKTEKGELDPTGDWGELDADGPRNKVGTEGTSGWVWDAFLTDADGRKYRVLDRQRWEYKLCKVVIYPTGDVKNVDNATPEQLAEYMREGAMQSVRMQRTVRWTVTTRFSTLFDGTSPYDRFTIIPYFCYFRRGRTRGFVDNAISPQEVLNKAVSQFVHILNTTANSGWIAYEGSLANMTDEDLQQKGSETALVLIVRKGFEMPKKIEPNQVPTGLDKLIEHAHYALKNVTLQDELRGVERAAISGVAEQAKQFAQQHQIAVPLDNLARTRHMVGDFIDYLISNFYDNERIFRITETDPTTGKEVTAEYGVNVYDAASGQWSNDLTVGTYDIVVSEQPMHVTFNSSQYQQAMEMRKEGLAIPDAEVLRVSSLARKSEIIEQIAAAPPKQSPLDEAKTQLTYQQADKVQADTAKVRADSIFATVQAAQTIAQVPGVGPVADAIGRSAGIKDQDAAPLVPAAPPGLLPNGPAQPIAPPNAAGDTSPLTPASPLNRSGVEGGGP